MPSKSAAVTSSRSVAFESSSRAEARAAWGLRRLPLSQALGACELRGEDAESARAGLAGGTAGKEPEDEGEPQLFPEPNLPPKREAFFGALWAGLGSVGAGFAEGASGGGAEAGGLDAGGGGRTGGLDEGGGTAAGGG